MGQAELYEYLKNNPGKWYEARVLRKKFGDNSRIITHIKWIKEIEFKSFNTGLKNHQILYLRYVGKRSI